MLQNYLPKSLSTSGKAALFLVALLVDIISTTQNSIESLIQAAPFYITFLLVAVGLFLRAKKLWRMPWLLILLGLLCKDIGWIWLSLTWTGPQVEGVILSPYFGNQIHILDALGTFLFLMFTTYILSSMELRFYGSGLIADCTILFISILIFTFILFNREVMDYLSAINRVNASVFVMPIFTAYYLFVGFFFVAIMQTKLRLQALFLAMLLVVEVHMLIEVYLNYVMPRSTGIWVQTSSIMYDISGILLLFYIASASEEELRLPKKPITLRLSPLIWVASGALLLATPTSLFIRDMAGMGAPEHFSGYVIASLAGVVVFLRFSMLIWLSRKQQQQLELDAVIDSMTGLLNRRGFIQGFDQYIESLQKKVSLLCLLDVDSFKAINDAYGHQNGDRVLKCLADKISQHRYTALAGRLGGDEFVLVLETQGEVSVALGALQESLAFWLSLEDGNRIYVRVSMGATLLKPADLFSRAYVSADLALYKAKRNYSGVTFEQPKVDNSGVSHVQSTLLAIQSALDHNRLVLHFQPFYRMDTGEMAGVEVLMRLPGADEHVYSPAEFIDVAHRHNKLSELSYLLIRQLSGIFRQLSDIIVSINLPPVMYEKEAMRERVLELFKQFNLPRGRLQLEITDGSDGDMQQLTEGVRILRKEGYRIALDDFGAGGSSLGRLASLSVDAVKVDIALLRAAEQGRNGLLENAVTLSHRLDAQVMVEGVESATQLAIVWSANVDMVQGFYLAKPLPLEQVVGLPNVSEKIRDMVCGQQAVDLHTAL